MQWFLFDLASLYIDDFSFLHTVVIIIMIIQWKPSCVSFLANVNVLRYVC